MIRFPIRHLCVVSVAALVIAFADASSSACLNDMATSAGENEFRSRYDPAGGHDAPSPAGRIKAGAINPWGVAGLAAGSGLVGGSCMLAFRRRKGQA